MNLDEDEEIKMRKDEDGKGGKWPLALRAGRIIRNGEDTKNDGVST